MKKLFVVLVILLLGCNLLLAQENLFENANTNIVSAKSIKEKIERLKTRKAIKNWEVVQLRSNIILSEDLNGILNIFDNLRSIKILEQI